MLLLVFCRLVVGAKADVALDQIDRLLRGFSRAMGAFLQDVDYIATLSKRLQTRLNRFKVGDYRFT